MLKKVLLVTLFDDNNIGNRLQNYALQRVLELRGAEVSIIDNGYTTFPSAKRVTKAKIQGVLCKLGYKKYKHSYEKYMTSEKIKISNEIFDKKNLTNVIRIKTEDVFKRDWSNYDVAIVGSDQVWHKWGDEEIELSFYYLQFIAPEKRSAYAASFGFTEFPKQDIEQHKDGLLQMENVSCRENTGCALVEEITGKPAVHVLDPTLLLSADEWHKLENRNVRNMKAQEEEYAFVYFLGGISEEYQKEISDIMKKKQIKKIVNFSNLFTLKATECGPSEFLGLIDGACYVFTDSFHCTVFSLLFDKKFEVFRRQQNGFEKMFSRIEELLSGWDKLDCIYGGTSVVASKDFEVIYKRSQQYIDQILEIRE